MSALAPAMGGGRHGMRLGSAAYETIKEQLLEGRWAAGQPLSLTALKDELEVSKQPIMEALRRLDSDGLVNIIPQVGCRVASFPPQEIEDFFALFGALEGAVVEVAATRCTARDLETMRGLNDEIGDLRASTDPEARSHGYRVLNRAFHAAIHRAARSQIVEEMSIRMWDRSDFLVNTSGGSHPFAGVLADRHRDHDAILDAFAGGDALTARRLMEHHITANVPIIQGARAETRST